MEIKVKSKRSWDRGLGVQI